MSGGVAGRIASGGRSGLRALLRTNPSPPRLGVAVSGGLAMLLAVGLPTLAGRQDLGLLASAGALSALYLAARSRRERVRRLPLVQLALVLASVLGAAASGEPLLAAAVLAVLAVAAAVLVLGFRIGPPGALFVVLVAGVSERLTAPAAAGGAGLAPALVVGGVVLGAAVAYAVVTAPLLLPGVRHRERAVPIEPLRFALTADDRVVLVRLAAGVVLATAVGGALGLHRAYWVVLAVVAVLQSARGRRPSAIRGVHRLAGTLVGVIAFAGLAALHPQGLLLALVVALLQLATELVVVRHYGVALVLITPLALTIAEAGAGGDVGPTVRDRVVDTVVGCAVAAVVLLADLAVDRIRARRRGADQTAATTER